MKSTSKEIKVGEELLRYASNIGTIQEELQEAYFWAEKCVSVMTSSEGYKGKATEELNLFFSSLADNLQKMILLYQAASSYLYNTYTTMYYSEEQLINWVIDEIGQG